MKLSLCEIKDMLNFTQAIPESDILEYKIQIHNHCMGKYIETICAFMNGTKKGGYLIFGVSDQLQIKGLNQKTNYDTYLLRFDNIIHQNLMYGIDSSGNMISMNNTNLKIDYHYNDKKQLFIIVDITNNNVDITYRLRSGNIYYRLNASNYVNRHELLYSQEMVDNKLKLKTKDYQQIIDSNLKLYNYEFEKLKKETTKEKQLLLNELDQKVQIIKQKELEYKELFDQYEKKIKPSICEIISMLFR